MGHEMFQIAEDTMDPSKKVAVTFDEETYQIGISFFKKHPRKLKQYSEKILKGVATYRNNHAYWLIEDTMRILIQAGIPQYVKNYIFEVYFREIQESKEKIPKVFGIDDLDYGFIVWLIACSIAVAGFVVELLWFYLRKGVKNFLGLYCLVRLISRHGN